MAEFPDDLDEIGRDLVDGDFLLVGKAKALLSRVCTYVAQKLFTQNELGRELADGDVITVLDSSTSPPSQKTATMSRVSTYVASKLPIVAGTWTSAGVAVTNVDTVGSVAGRYLRIGTTVFCWGNISVDATAAAAMQFDLPLPVTSNLGSAWGLMNGSGITNGRISQDSAEDRLACFATATTTSEATAFLFATYEVVSS